MKTDKKQSIYLAAAKIFGEKGFDRASLDEVAERAGVAKGTIFYHFKSKETLFNELLKDGIGKLAHGIDEITARDISAREKLDLIVGFHFDFFKKNRDICLIIIEQTGSLQKRWKGNVELIRSVYMRSMEKVIIEAKKEGLIGKKIDTESLAIALFSLLAVAGIDWSIFHPELPEDRMISTIRTLLMRGLGDK